MSFIIGLRCIVKYYDKAILKKFTYVRSLDVEQHKDTFYIMF